jgi:hypothetical protein
MPSARSEYQMRTTIAVRYLMTVIFIEVTSLLLMNS